MSKRPDEEAVDQAAFASGPGHEYPEQRYDEAMLEVNTLLAKAQSAVARGQDGKDPVGQG